jgi:hypothetical protein
LPESPGIETVFHENCRTFFMLPDKEQASGTPHEIQEAFEKGF